MNLLNPADPPERREEKLIRICQSLMHRVEHASNDNASAYQQFQRAVMLEEQVRERTLDLEKTLSLLNTSNTQLAAASEAAQTARAHLSNALDALQEGFALFGADDRLIMFNQRFCRQMPDVVEHLCEGLHLEAYISLVGRSRYVDLSKEGGAEAWVAQRLRMHSRRHAMFNLKLADGSYFQVSEQRTADGGAAIIQTDVTEMIQAERAERARQLDDQAELVRATLDHIDRGVVIFNDNLRMVGWNRQLGALLVPPANLVRVGVRFKAMFDAITADVEFLDGATPERLWDWVENRADRGAHSFDARRGDLTLSVLARVLPDGGFVMSFSDITAERAAIHTLRESKNILEARVEERTRELQTALGMAEQANQTKTRFVAAVGHDLMQPLSAAKLYLASFAAMSDQPETARVAGMAESALQSVEAIVGDLLEISKLDSGKAMMRLAPVPLHDLLLALSHEFQPAAAAKGVTLRIRPSDLWVRSDANYLRRILQNLISNAVRYTTNGGVLVGVRRRGDAARVEVWDTGPGVPENRREEIFEEFNRLDAAVSASEGLGLGLSIVDRAAKALGHPVYLRSRQGRGSCFAIEAPLATADEAAAPSRDQSPLVLVVASDDERRRAIAAQLETWGLLVMEAGGGAELRALISDTGVRPDAVLTDRANAVDPVEGVRAHASILDNARIAVIARRGDAALPNAHWTMLREPLNASDVLEFIASATPPSSGMFPGAS